jgi:SagB-type dehydrogenase family enzyme
MKPYAEMIKERRKILKSLDIESEEYTSHQTKGVPPPPLEKPFPKRGFLVDLPDPNTPHLGEMSVAEAIRRRQSRRKFTDSALTLEELSFLLWSTQGVRNVDKQHRVWTRRTVPSAGSRHPFETYLIVKHVNNVKPGIHRYLPIEHKLLQVNSRVPSAAQVSQACSGQSFIGEAAVVFIWTVIPYRSEWRYSTVAYRGILVDVGHVCQNLYLACETMGAGTCAVLAFEQNLMDSLIGVDGEDEFTIYLAPVGKVGQSGN